MNKQEHLKYVENATRGLLTLAGIVANKSQTQVEETVTKLISLASDINTQEAYIFENSKISKFMGFKMFPLKDKVLLLSDNNMVTSVELVDLNENQTPEEKIKQIQGLMEQSRQMTEDFLKG